MTGKKVAFTSRIVTEDGAPRSPLKGAGPVRIRTEHEVMASINVRLPRALFDWLNDQAAEDRSSVSEVVRTCIAAAIVREGNAAQYGIEIISEDEYVEDES